MATLIDDATGQPFRPATQAEIDAADASGFLLLDADDNIIGQADVTEPWVAQPVRKVWVTE